jgi:hypothetical protein
MHHRCSRELLFNHGRSINLHPKRAQLNLQFSACYLDMKPPGDVRELASASLGTQLFVTRPPDVAGVTWRYRVHNLHEEAATQAANLGGNESP